MLKLVHACASWLTWKTAGIGALVLGGVLLCTGLPSLTLLAGTMPLVLLLACLVPCAIPLLLLRKPKTAPISTSATESGQEGVTCGCGQATCSAGLGLDTHRPNPTTNQVPHF